MARVWIILSFSEGNRGNNQEHRREIKERSWKNEEQSIRIIEIESLTSYSIISYSKKECSRYLFSINSPGLYSTTRKIVLSSYPGVPYSG